MHGIEILLNGFQIARGPGADVFVHFDEIHEAGDIQPRSLLQGVRSIRAEAMGIELFRFREQAFSELIGGSMLAANFVAKSPNH